MRFFVVGFALLAVASAGVLPVDYLPPVQELALPTAEYLPPAEAAVVEEPTVLADDGYRYKTVKKLRLRHRRDVNEVVANEYLPPVEEATFDIAAEDEPIVDSAILADDGYRYKTVKKLRFRKRRDVNEVVANEYLPPVEEATFDIAAEDAPIVDSAVLADDGYRYKTVKKLRFRKRRDVNEVVANEYLPPVEEATFDIAAEDAPIVDSAVLADDGYRYKTVKKLRFRKRRDVNEVVANEYLPPVEEAVEIAEVEPVVDSAVLADDGYRYKTVKKLRFRKRRDVNEVVANEYLPPVEEAVEIAEVEPVVDSAVLADDGYRYKTVKKLRFRKRRDVNEVVANEYLPPVEEAVEIAEVEPVVDSAVLADDGYRYKTVKKLRFRKRRDVNEVVANEYLPPVEEAVEIAEVEPVVDSAVLADDGYRYKTVKKLRFRKRRDVNEVVANEYLPPVEEAVEIAEVEPVVDSAVLADDGYRYKTVKKLRFRKRRDVNEVVANEYLPPVEEAVVDVDAPVAEVAPVADSAVLADDGYRYKTVKKLRYRYRH